MLSEKPMMSDSTIPLIIPPSDVKPLLSGENIKLIDLSQAQTYIKGHVPGAVFLDYSWIVDTEQPRVGLLPDPAQLSRVLSAFGIGEHTHVIAYDDEGGGRACRFLWTLQCVGHEHLSLIDGGLHAWAGEGHELEQTIHFPDSVQRQVHYTDARIADKQFILEHLQDNNVVILDARSPEEYRGNKVFAARGGHIPGAINFEWTSAMDKQQHLKLKDRQTLLQDLQQLGITPDKTIVCHCQSHHRSAHTCVMLNSLGFENVKGYPGSWSDWGNDPSVPVES